MLKKITKWETEDGKVFDTQEEAEGYMFEQEKEVMTQDTEQDHFDSWYEENIGYGADDCWTDTKAMLYCTKVKVKL